MSALTDHLATRLIQLGLPEPVAEYRFDARRRWRFDLAWPDRRIAAEIDGGTWIGGRHTRGAGYRRDCEKLNAAELQGWHVLRFTSDMVQDDTAAFALELALDPAAESV